MAILEIGSEGIKSVPRTSLVSEGVRERADLQRVLLASIGVVAPDVMVLAEEFAGWQDSRRRIDILGLDTDGNLVVVELKRTEDGGHMELQALRYAAMVSVMTFDQAVEVHQQFLDSKGLDGEAREAILRFLGWDEPDDERFGQDARVVLVSVEFSKEITTTVLWLNAKGIDIRCVRLTPYRLGERLLVDIQQIIPLPEAAEFQTRVREKELTKRESRATRDHNKFTLRLGSVTTANLGKRHAIHAVFRHLADRGVSPEDVAHALSVRRPETVLLRFDGDVDEAFIKGELAARQGAARKGRYHPRRWFCSDEELLRSNGYTYVVSNQWGHRTERALRNIAAAFPQHGIDIETVNADEE